MKRVWKINSLLNARRDMFVSFFFLLQCILLSDIAASQSNILAVDSFNGLKEGTAPAEWAIKEWNGKADVHVVKDETGHVLRPRN